MNVEIIWLERVSRVTWFKKRGGELRIIDYHSHENVTRFGNFCRAVCGCCPLGDERCNGYRIDIINRTGKASL